MLPMEAETQSEQKGTEVGLGLFKDAWFTSLALSHFPSQLNIFFSLNAPVHDGSLAAVGYFPARTCSLTYRITRKILQG